MTRPALAAFGVGRGFLALAGAIASLAESAQQCHERPSRRGAPLYSLLLLCLQTLVDSEQRKGMEEMMKGH
jgi:hypothetical protein